MSAFFTQNNTPFGYLAELVSLLFQIFLKTFSTIFNQNWPIFTIFENTKGGNVNSVAFSCCFADSTENTETLVV
jgi:hypothetical protein